MSQCQCFHPKSGEKRPSTTADDDSASPSPSKRHTKEAFQNRPASGVGIDRTQRMFETSLSFRIPSTTSPSSLDTSSEVPRQQDTVIDESQSVIEMEDGSDQE